MTLEIVRSERRFFGEMAELNIGCTETVFNAWDRVITPDGLATVSSLTPGAEILTRSTFQRITGIRSVASEEQIAHFPAMHCTSQSSFWGDSRRILFLSGKALLRATGLSRALLRFSDLLKPTSEHLPYSARMSGVVLEFEKPEIVLTDIGPFASTCVGSPYRVLSADQAARAFDMLVKDTGNGPVQ